jgi:hypothetical protein
MSLNWNVTKCNQTACWTKDKDGDEFMSTMCEGLIWTTMLVEMGEITEPKLEEFVWRMNFANKHGAGILQKDKKETPYTEEDLKPFIGLSTNVLTKTRKQWLKYMIERMEREHNASERNRREEAAKGGAA